MVNTRLTLEQALDAASGAYWEWSYDTAYRCFMRLGMKGSQLVELARVRAEKQYERQYGLQGVDLVSLDQARAVARQYYWCMAYGNAYLIAVGSGCSDAVSKYIAESWADRDTDYQFACPDSSMDEYAECSDKCRHYIVEV